MRLKLAHQAFCCLLIITGMSYQTSASQPAPVDTALNKQLEAMYQAYYGAIIATDPWAAAKLNAYSSARRLPAYFSPQFRAIRQQQLESSYQTAVTLKKRFKNDFEIGRSQLIELNSFLFRLQNELLLQQSEQYFFADYLIFFNWLAVSSNGSGEQPFYRLKDYEHWFGVIESVTPIVQQITANLRREIINNNTASTLATESFLTSLKSFTAMDAEHSIFYGAVHQLPKHLTAVNKQYVIQRYKKAIENSLLTPLSELIQFIEDDYLPKTNAQLGLNHRKLANLYIDRIAYQSGVSVSPLAMHQWSTQQVSAYESRLFRLSKTIETDEQSSPSEIFQTKRYRFDEPSQLFRAYQTASSKASQAVANTIQPFPSTTYQIQLVARPYEAPRVEYKFDQGEATLLLNGARLADFTQGQIMFDIVNQVMPGSHFLNAYGDKSEPLSPYNQRAWPHYSIGWKRYALALADQLNLFTSDAEQWFYLNYARNQAAIVVVDTGMHALGWDRNKLQSYLEEHSSFTESQRQRLLVQVELFPGQLVAAEVVRWQLETMINNNDVYEEKTEQRLSARELHRNWLQYGPLPVAALQTVDGK